MRVVYGGWCSEGGVVRVVYSEGGVWRVVYGGWCIEGGVWRVV